MRNNNDGGLEGASFRELRLLEEVEATHDLSQRGLAGNVGIALGVVNVLVRALVNKGYVRATRVSWKRWAYMLTPAGMARKVQLTVNYVDRFFDHYRKVRSMVNESVGVGDTGPESVVAIYGTAELAELMFLALRGAGVSRIEFLDDTDSGEFLGAQVRPLDTIDPGKYAKILVGYHSDVESRCQRLVDIGVLPDRITTLLGPLRSEDASEGSEATAS